MEKCRKLLSLSRRTIFPLLLRRNLSTTRIVAAGYWNKDWKPGPYPTTPEEREAAAKKYGLRLEDYDVYPDDGLGYGDYPKLPVVSGDSKDPYEDWDFPELKRNYGEPLHVEADIIGEDRLDYTTKRLYSDRFAALYFLGFVGTLALLFVLAMPYPDIQPAMPKQFPFNDLYLEKGGDPEKMPTIKHYTFEPAD
ncbi:NADH dehydrogenase [ubiquinone] 1 beta subcomplex subunit 8, mitochondrial-like [Liolophura sinensis]|uniref:NADH dehydrogenase [ubiquinone] 1 beta subcomplex subunit 8, mitochondrial-like n=1 Tax=Liolophura sinensis TaxID=3198878 RepID=UPI0031591933